MGQVRTTSKIDNERFEKYKDDSIYTFYKESDMRLWSTEQNAIQFIAKITMFKWPYFKNRNNDSTLLFRSILVVFISAPIIIFFIFFLIKIFSSFAHHSELDFANNLENCFSYSINYLNKNASKVSLHFITGVAAYYFFVRSRFSKQWEYCANLYNKISFENISNCDPRDILYQRVTLSLDLLQVDLYAHPSFSTVFNIALEKAVRYCYEYHEKDARKKVDEAKNFWATLSKENLEEELARIKNGHASIQQIKVYLSRMQNDFDNLMTLDYTLPE